MANSSKANIALSKTKVTGVVFVGDKTSKLPTDGTSALDSTFVNVGYISDDGIENDTDIKTKDVTEMGGRTVLTVISSYSETYAFTMDETNATALALRYGTSNVKTGTDGAITIDHAMPDGESKPVVIEIPMTNGKIKRILIPEASLSDVDKITYSSGDPIGYSVTLAANASDSIGGATSREWITTPTTTTTTTTPTTSGSRK